jgi:hypothetical protein
MENKMKGRLWAYIFLRSWTAGLPLASLQTPQITEKGSGYLFLASLLEDNDVPHH